MADNNDELSAEELDALLGDLSSRSDAPAVSDDAGDDDIEAFLADLEGDDYVAPPETKTKEPDPLADEFASLEPPEKAEVAKVPKEGESAKAEKKSKKAKKDAVKVVEKGGSPGLRLFLTIAKWTLLLLPVVAATWVVGAYLAAWVSAGWLIALMALVLILGLPTVAVIGLKKGRYIYWLSGLALVLTVGLVAPLATQAAEALSRYGHWPVTAVTAPAGLDSDNVFASTSAWASEKLANLLTGGTATLPVASQLGGDDPLDPEDVPPVDAEGEGDEEGTPGDTTEESADDSTESEPPTSDESETETPEADPQP